MKKTPCFSGDSGNDPPALTSGLQAVLVRNARDEVRQEAVASLGKQGLADRLYLAGGNFHGMNGNYAADGCVAAQAAARYVETKKAGK